MGFVGFLNFGLKCIQLLAWPSLALVYPLCASIQAIETNSKHHMRKLVTYWILFSLISLFEHAFEKLIEWFPFWPCVKISAVCWLVIPSFSGAYNVYKSLVRPCLSLHLLEVVINLLNKNQELSLKGETFLAVAERYVNENGTEALEKLIAKKGALQKFDVEEIKSDAAGDKKEVATLIQNKEAIVAQKDIKAVEILEENAAAPENSGALQKFDVEEIESDAVGDKKEVATLIQPKNKEAIVAQKDIKAVKILEENAAAPENSVKNVDTRSSQTENKTSITMEIKNMMLPATIGENALPESPALEYVQKEWTCAVCQVTTQSEATLNSHLQGMKHKLKCEELKARKETAKNKNPSSTTGNKLNQSEQVTKGVSNGGLDKEWTCAVCQVTTHSEEMLNSHLQGVKHRSKCEELKASEQTAKKNNSSSSTPKSDQANQDPTRGSSGGGPNKQWSCALCQVTLQSEATRNSHFNGSKHRSKCEQLKASRMAAKNENSSSASKTYQANQHQKKNVSAGGLNKNTSNITKVKMQADVNTLKHWCSFCDLTCTSEIDMASHLKGKRHLSKIQDLVDSAGVHL